MKHKFHIIGLVIAFVALYYTFKNISFDQLKHALATAKYHYMIYVFIILVIRFYFTAVRWRYLVRPIKQASSSSLISPLMIGFMGNLLPARAGEFIRAYLLGKKLNISFSAAFGTIFIERIFDLLVLIILIIWILMFKSHLFTSIEVLDGRSLEGVLYKFGWVTLISALGLITFCYLLIHAKERMIKIIHYISTPIPDRFRLKLHELIHAFVEGLSILKDFKSVFIVFVLSLFIWAMIILAYLPFYYAFSIDALPISSLVVAVVINAIFITLFPTPGYLGSFQLSFVIALHNIYGTSEPVAVSFGILSWFIMMLFVSAAGILCVYKEGVSLTELSHRGEETI